MVASCNEVFGSTVQLDESVSYIVVGLSHNNHAGIIWIQPVSNEALKNITQTSLA